jgi:hypothetical protein
MNAKNAAPLIVTLPAIAAAAPPLIIGGAIFVGFAYFCEWLMSDDEKEKKPESIPLSAPSAPVRPPSVSAAPSRPALVIPSVSGGNSAQNHSIPADSGGISNVTRNTPPHTTTAPLVMPSAIPAMKIVQQIPLPSPIKKKFVTREDVATVFQRGARPLTRTAAVAELKNLGFGKTAAYAAITPDGRFSAWLQFAPDGIITWTDY